MYKVLFQTLEKQVICDKTEKEEFFTEFLTFHLANELETYSARVYKSFAVIRAKCQRPN